jgi:hypothetical protein
MRSIGDSRVAGGMGIRQAFVSQRDFGMGVLVIKVTTKYTKYTKKFRVFRVFRGQKAG